jgi:hypothetical protein
VNPRDADPLYVPGPDWYADPETGCGLLMLAALVAAALSLAAIAWRRTR